jgi:hypothetical protein
MDRFLAQQISMHGITPAFQEISDTAQTQFFPDSDDDAMQQEVFGQIHDDRQNQRLVVDTETGAAVDLMEPPAAMNAATANLTNSSFGEELMTGAELANSRGRESNVGPAGIIHTGPFPVPKPPGKGIRKVKVKKSNKVQKSSKRKEGAAGDDDADQDDEMDDQSGEDANQGDDDDEMGGGGGRSRSRKRSASKRTRRRKGVAKKTKSKKNKRQSRRKVRRSSSRKAGRK